MSHHHLLGLLDEQLERRTPGTTHGGQRTLQTPQTMQWAVRQRGETPSGTGRQPTTSTTTTTSK